MIDIEKEESCQCRLDGVSTINTVLPRQDSKLQYYTLALNLQIVLPDTCTAGRF